MLHSADPALLLVLQAARARLEPEGRERLRRLALGPLDWQRVLRLASRHGLLPLAYHHLGAAAAELVPATVREALGRHFRGRAVANLAATAQLFRVLDRLAGGGVEAMPYKGPALAAALYGHLSLREFADLDVLVRPRDVPRASALLEQAGYRPHFALRGARLAAHVRLSYVQLFSRTGEHAVELHWGVAPRFFAVPFDVEALWPRLSSIELAGRPVLAPAPHDLLTMLAIHGAKDLWARLEWVAAVGELLRAPGLDGERLMRGARAVHAERIVLLALDLAHRLVGAPRVAAAEPMRARDPALAALSAEVERRLLGEAEEEPSLLWRSAFHLRTRERWRDRVRYCARLSLTTTADDWAAWPVPEALSFLHPLVRAVRLADKYLVPGRAPGPKAPPPPSGAPEP